MIKYIDEGLVTDEVQVASMFLGESLYGGRMLFYGINRAETPYGDTEFMFVDLEATEDAECLKLEILIRWPLVEAAIEPVEGEPSVIDEQWIDAEKFPGLCVHHTWPPARPWEQGDAKGYHKRVLNIVTTRAELRELIANIEKYGGKG